MSIDGICVQVRGNVQLGFLLRETQFGLRRKEKRISAFRGAKRRRAQQKKRLRAASNFVGGTLPLAFAR